MENYNIALEKRSALIAAWRAWDCAGGLAAYVGYDSGLPPDHSLPMIRQVLKKGSGGDVIYVENEIINALTPYIQGVPMDWSLHPDMLVSDAAFYWWELPFFQSEALQDRTAFVSRGMILVSDGSGVCYIPLSVAAGEVFPIAWTTLAFGHSLGTIIARVATKEAARYSLTDQQHDRLKNFLITELKAMAVLLEFMSGLITKRTHMSPSRATRRRLPETDVSDVVVITLRRTQYESAVGSATHREYSHRFIVRAHWRRQWYPSAGIHRPRLIPQYVKGPDDKPLVVKSRVFHLRR